jgi:hypothetical protein
MPCRRSHEFSNHWAEVVLARASVLLFDFGTKRYPDSNETFQAVGRFIDIAGQEYFLIPKVSLSFPTIYGEEDQAPDAQISLDWEVEGRRLKLNLTSDGMSGYVENFPEQVTKSGPIDLCQPDQVRSLLMALVGVSMPSDDRVCAKVK